MTRLDVGGGRSVSAAEDGPPDGRRVVLAHGAGGSMDSGFLRSAAAALGRRGLRVARFNFRYAEEGRRRPDGAPALLATWRVAASELGGASAVLGGKSMGGRYATVLLAGEGPPPAAGCVLFGYPLHPPGRPDRPRTAHLRSVRVPMLFLGGTRDPFARQDLLEEAVSGLRLARLVVIDGADHDFRVPGRAHTEVIEELGDVTARFGEEVGPDL